MPPNINTIYTTNDQGDGNLSMKLKKVKFNPTNWKARDKNPKKKKTNPTIDHQPLLIDNYYLCKST